VDLVVFVNILVEVLLPVQDAASIVDLMVIGLETAKQVTGRTNVIVVGKEATLKETARTVLKSSGICVSAFWILELKY
jgi:hypothetical protein